MKKLIALVLVLVMLLTLASCNLLGGENGGNVTETTTTTTTTSSTTTTTKPTTTTNSGGNNNPKEDYTYVSFTASEKSTMLDLLGEVIPFIANNEYYLEYYTYDYDDGTTEVGVNFYTVGNTQSEFNNYRATYSKYTYEGSEVDDYGDRWYMYTSPNGDFCVDMSYYLYEGNYIVDVYAYIMSQSGGNGGSTSGHTYTAFTSSDKALLSEIVGSTNVPFLANDEYYVEEYSYDYGDGTSEVGVNFYTCGNTQAEFNAYKSLFSSYTYDGSEVDEYGDMWYFYTAPNGSFYVDLSYYETEDYGYVVDVYFYYITESGSTGGNGGNGGGSSSTDVDLITNAGAGLPNDPDGVYDVNFKDAEYVKDVTNQGYYLDGCPTTGSPAVLVIPVQFSDAMASNKGYTTDALVEAFSKNGDVDYYSVYDYYYISSYGQLTLDITVLDFWFTPQYSSTYYYDATYNYSGTEVEIGDQLVLDEALSYLEGIMDLSKFDSDNNGVIDSVVLINTLDVGEEDFYWAYRYWNIYTDDQGYYYEYDGVSANDYLWASYQFLYETYDENGETVYDSSVRNTYTFIHEFAHILGADDYYDTSYSDNSLLLDGADMMDVMTGDHNAFTKFNLGWITTSKLVVTNSSVTINLNDFTKTGDTIIIANNWDEKLGAYQEYYILVYYTNNGLNAGDDYGYFSRDGIVVYHVNASLYREVYEGEIYYDIYNNNTDASDDYGTEDNLIEFVKSGEDTFTYIVGSTFTNVIDDNGNALIYTFTVDEITSEYATVKITKR